MVNKCASWISQPAHHAIMDAEQQTTAAPLWRSRHQPLLCPPAAGCRLRGAPTSTTKPLRGETRQRRPFLERSGSCVVLLSLRSFMIADVGVRRAASGRSAVVCGCGAVAAGGAKSRREPSRRIQGKNVIRVPTMMALLLIPLAPLLFSSGLAAPRSGGRLEVPENVLNPFTPGPEQLSLLQEYLQDEDPMEENPSDMKRESVILHLFVLYDFDKSGLLDGLELMRLLRRILTKSLQREPAEDSVISLVDDILVTQDLNQDGLLSAQELVTPPVSNAEDSLPVNMAIPIPPGAHPEASENDTQVHSDSTDTLEAADQEVESKDNVKEQVNEQAEAETAQEEPAVTEHEAAFIERANESEEMEEPTEDDGEQQVSQEEVVVDNEM